MSEFRRLLNMVRRLAEETPGHVLIGGVAVYLHAISRAETRGDAETSHDADLMISLVDLASLRDTDEVVNNRRLSKRQVTRDGMEFDVYVERQNDLAVPYDEAVAHAATFDDIRVASLEHLLIMKLDAYADRASSSKGDKDMRDVVMIVRIMRGKFHASLLVPYLRRGHIEALKKIARSRVFTDLAKGNAHRARKSRLMFEDLLQTIVEMTGRNDRGAQ
jgi:hypothetical protein